MHVESTITEIQVPSVLADFEAGDKVACARLNNASLIGTVVSVEQDSMWINIASSGPKPMKVTNTGMENIFHVSRWRKVPDQKLIEPGSIMSTNDRRYMASLNDREFFVVTTMVPWQLIVLRSLEDIDSTIQFDDFAYGNLDEYLQYWELED